MTFRNAAFASLFCYLISLAATQTVYGRSLDSMRWIALIAFFSFGALSYFASSVRHPVGSLNRSVLVYILLWTGTDLFGVYPRFSLYRFVGHALIIVSSLVFLPQMITIKNSSWLPNVIKAIVAVAAVVSYVQPARTTVFDTGNEFRGIFGNANSFGHMCSVGALLFFHGVLTKGRSFWGYIQGSMMLFSVFLMYRSGARSSTLALIAGVLTLLYFYKDHFSRNALVGWCLLTAILITPLTFKNQISSFLVKHDDSTIKDPLSRLTGGRVPIMTSSLEAFEERPVFGWGFGVDKETNLTNWNGQFTSTGFLSHDPVNDFTYTLETGGIAGILAYILLLSQTRRFWLTREQLIARTPYIQKSDRGHLDSALEDLQLFMALALSLVIEFEFDGTALSVGYFFAPLLWISVGISASLYAQLVYIMPRQLWLSYYARQRSYLTRRFVREG